MRGIVGERRRLAGRVSQEIDMRPHPAVCLAALAGVLLVSGCALRDPRDGYAYGRADGLWDANYDLLRDWNFPTSANQGPLEPPTRFLPERAAVGVPWATGNPMKPQPAPGSDAPPSDAAPSGEASRRDAGDHAPRTDASSGNGDAMAAGAGAAGARRLRVGSID
jgi:hypothetical protein